MGCSAQMTRRSEGADDLPNEMDLDNLAIKMGCRQVIVIERR